MKPDKRKEYLEIMIKEFRRYHKDYPQGNFQEPLAKLEKQLVEHVSKIGQPS